MKSLLELFAVVTQECGDLCCTSTQRDLETVHARVEHEGLSFLTITLPTFCRDFEFCLDKGSVESHDFDGFRRRGKLPAFLSGFLAQVFDPETGALLSVPCTEAIRCVRQITLFASKVNLDCTDTRVRAAYLQYIQTELDVCAWEWTIGRDRLMAFSRMANFLFARLFSGMDYDIHYGRLVPSHGPGSTADGLKGNLKFTQHQWPSRLDQYFPASDFLIGSYRHWEDLDGIEVVSPRDEMPVKVITVPKTQKTPRIIAMEPTCMMYAQQALRRSYMDHWAKDPVLSSMIGFDDQSANQRMARSGSITGDLATLDLSEASDRVSNLLVTYMMRHFPHVEGAVQACRSTRADVPGFGIVSLSKFASMGSSLTFPIEASVFLTLVMMGVEDALGRSLNRKDLFDLRGSVRIYGDDIVVPTEYVPFVVDRLVEFNLVVNDRKSFWNGKFRESCGAEYYAGDDVTVFRYRYLYPDNEPSPADVERLVALRNNAYRRGFWSTAREIDRMVERVLPAFPVVLETSTVLGRHSFLGYEVERIGGRYQSPQVRGVVLSRVKPSSYLDDDSALLKVFLDTYGSLQPTFEGHLERAGRPVSVNMKTRWASPF